MATNRTERQRLRIHLVIAIGVSLAVALTSLAGLFTGIEALSLDLRHRLLAPAAPVPRFTAHVSITQECLREMQEGFDLAWPWPREAYARITSRLFVLGARAVVFDFVFSEPSLFGVADDAGFAAAMAAGPVFAGMNLSERADDPAVRERIAALEPAARESLFAGQAAVSEPLAGFTLTNLTLDRDAQVPEFLVLGAPPTADLLPGLSGIGNVSLSADSDGTVRRKRLLFRHRDRFWPDLALAPLLDPRATGSLVLSPYRLQLVSPDGGRNEVPLDRDGNLLLAFAGSYHEVYRKHTVPAADLLALPEEKLAETAKEKVAGRIVIVGSTAASLLDLRANPFSATDPGAFLYSTAIENILSGRMLREADPLPALLPILLLCLPAALARRRLQGGSAILSLAVLFAAWIAAVLALQHHAGIVTSFTPAAIALLFTFFGMTFADYLHERRQKTFIEGAFAQVLAPAVLEKLLADPETLSLGGERKELSIFFSDLAGFTTLSEALGSPERLVAILNEYLTAMADIIILEHGGYVDKYEGDAIMAFWGAPLPEDQHAARACAAALDNRRRLGELATRFAALGLPAGLSVRIGINSGDAVVGMMGSLRKLNYTIIGDAVNLASRLEGANKQFGTTIMISEATRLGAGGGFVTRELDLIRVKGKSEPTRVHELVARRGEIHETGQALLETFSAGLVRYRSRDFSGALAAFERALALEPGDGPSRVYADRCRLYLANPPAPDWDGVFTMQSK